MQRRESKGEKERNGKLPADSGMQRRGMMEENCTVQRNRGQSYEEAEDET